MERLRIKKHILLSSLLFSSLVACSPDEDPEAEQVLKCSDLQCEDSLRSCNEGGEGEDASCGGCLEVAQERDGSCVASCPEDTFNKGDAENPECQAYTTCTAEEYESKKPRPDADRECSPVSACDEGEYESAAPTADSDRECSELSQCEPGEYESAAPTADSDRECSELSQCEPGEFVSTAHTESSDRECSPCAEGTFSDSANAATCEQWKSCDAGTYVSQEGSAAANRECSTCEEGTFSDDLNQDSCKSWLQCKEDEYQSAAPSSASDRQCSTLSECVPGEYVSVAPEEDADRECSPCASGEYSDHENAESCSAHSPQCDSDQFEQQIASSSQDRICTPLTECGAYEYEVTPPTPASDRVCDDVPEIEGMVYIPAGSFDMGTPSGGSDNERPVTEVTLSPYYISRTPVTVAEYGFCVDEGECQEPATTNSLCNWGKSERANHPINCVSWDQAKAFCEWRGNRLPTEAQWEFAARGTDGRTYPWGEGEPGDKACWSGLVDRYPDLGTCEVGTHSSGQSPFGLEDMAGNVWESVADWYGDYPGGSVEDPEGPADGDYRVLRGGSWSGDGAGWLRAGVRHWVRADSRGNYFGFRCARGAVFD